MKWLWRYTICFWVAIVLWGLPMSGWSQETIRARVGLQIRSGDRTLRAKTHDRVLVGDLIRLYVSPEQAAYVYVVYTDGKEVLLLNSEQQQKKMQSDDMMVLPDSENFYRITAGSSEERFTIICSYNELPDVSALFNGTQTSVREWLQVEENLEKKGSIKLGKKVDKPVPIAGNTRGMGATDPFFNQLQSFSGTSVLVKTYAFKVAK